MCKVTFLHLSSFHMYASCLTISHSNLFIEPSSQSIRDFVRHALFVVPATSALKFFSVLESVFPTICVFGLVWFGLIWFGLVWFGCLVGWFWLGSFGFVRLLCVVSLFRSTLTRVVVVVVVEWLYYSKE